MNRNSAPTRLVRQGIVIAALWLPGTVSTACAEAFRLPDDPADARTVRVTVSVNVEGKIVTLKTGGEPEPRPLKVEAGFEWLERRLAGTGRDARAFRSVRFMERARSEVHSGEQQSFMTLRPAVQLLVAQGEERGLAVFSPSAPLTARELTFLSMPGDPLLAHALLPDGTVESGDTWKPADWVPQSIALLDASQKSELSCKLDEIKDGVANVSFTGSTEGLTDGAAAKITFQGRFQYHIADKLLTHLEMTQVEKRAFGPVSPGLDLTAKVVVDRRVDPTATRLSETALKDVPLEPNDANQLLSFDVSPWGLDLLHARDWHLFQQTPQTAIFRQVKQGSLIAQVNIQRAPKPADGQPLALEKFEADVRKALDKNLKEIVQTQEFKTQAGLRALRIVASGEAQGNAMQWHYHLVTNGTGEGLVLVFVLEPDNAERMGAADLQMIESIALRSPAAQPRPTPASQSTPKP